MSMNSAAWRSCAAVGALLVPVEKFSLAVFKSLSGDYIWFFNKPKFDSRPSISIPSSSLPIRVAKPVRLVATSTSALQ